MKYRIFPNDMAYDEDEPIPECFGDDYIIREGGVCEKCGDAIIPHYDEPLASCGCMTQEWYK
jgi:hypothetical protein